MAMLKENKKKELKEESEKEAKQEALRVTATTRLKNKPNKRPSSDLSSDNKRGKPHHNAGDVLTIISEGNNKIFELMKSQSLLETRRVENESANASARLLEAENNKKLMDVLARLVPKTD